MKLLILCNNKCHNILFAFVNCYFSPISSTIIFISTLFGSLINLSIQLTFHKFVKISFNIIVIVIILETRKSPISDTPSHPLYLIPIHYLWMGCSLIVIAIKQFSNHVLQK